MSERSTNESWDRRLPLYSYLEPLWAGRKVLEIGCGSGEGAEYLVSHGAARVVSIDAEQGPVEKARARFHKANLEFRSVAHLADLSKLGESFDLVVVPTAGAAVLRADLIAVWKRALSEGGHLVVAAGNADRTGAADGAATGGAGYYQLTDALSPHFTRVQMFGQTPFLGVGMIEFDAPADGLRVDTRLLEGEGEPASHYVAIAGAGDAVPLGYALIQVPYAPVEARLRAAPGAPADRDAAAGAGARRDVPGARIDDQGPGARAKLDEAEGRISDLRRRLDDTTVQSESAMRIARAQSDEIEDLRARLRRSGEDRAALDGEIAKLRRALAEADESVLALTRRTAEEMTAVAARLSASLRAPEDSAAGKAHLAEVAALRDQAEDLRVRLVETEARAGAAERRLEETATAARDREHQTADLRARLRRAEDALERERLAVSALQEQARVTAGEIEQLAHRAEALHGRDERIARLEGDKQDLAWRTAELEEKLRTAIARAVSAESARGAPAGGFQAAPLPPPPPPPLAHPHAPPPILGPLKEELAEVRAARDRAVEEFHRVATTHVEELTRLQGSAAEQSVLVAELEESLRAAEARAATAAAEAAALRKGSRELEEADRSRRARLAELEGKLLRLEHEKKAVAQAVTGAEELERKLQAAETERETLRAERDLLRAQASARAAAAHAGNGNGHPSATAPAWSAAQASELSADLAAIEDDLRAETLTLGSLEAALAAAPAPGSDGGRPMAGGSPSVPPSDDEAARAHNILANFRRRAQALRDEIEGYRRRLDTLSPAEVSMLLDELGEGLAEFEA
ncbi:MAG TPA: methyltransferase domain-containing protein [Polyangia bacterium]|jgi:SAM-dependent methyltransferase|nr:methyltransferase domain-containing protein [Polyangia bacterium]